MISYYRECEQEFLILVKKNINTKYVYGYINISDRITPRANCSLCLEIRKMFKYYIRADEAIKSR